MSLKMEKVCFWSGDKSLISNLSFELATGEIVGLIGPNGAGKSTALKLLSGQLKATTGVIRLVGRDISELAPAQLALSRSVMAQTTDVVFDFTVREILSLGWVQGRIVSSALKDLAIKEIVDTCNISDLLDRTFNTLSGGEQQRVQFARNLLQLWRPLGQPMEARYLLLDEPTSSMDLRHELALLKQIQEAKQQNVGILIVIHDLNLAARYLDRVLLMSEGRLLTEGHPEDVLTASRLSQVYQTNIQVERHAALNRLVIHT